MWLLKPQCVGYRTKLVLYPLCVGNSQASSVCHSFFIHSSLRPFIHAVAIRSSLSFYHHLFFHELNTFLWIRQDLPFQWLHLLQCLVGCQGRARQAKEMSNDYALSPWIFSVTLFSVHISVTQFKKILSPCSNIMFSFFWHVNTNIYIGFRFLKQISPSTRTLSLHCQWFLHIAPFLCQAQDWTHIQVLAVLLTLRWHSMLLSWTQNSFHREGRRTIQRS